jgi:ABC-type transport system involved in cytochrome bd biosynthesis fused ATPase/permease subunit
VVGDLIKRLFNGLVLFLALLMFFLVPIGKKTAAQHLIAIFSTKPAKEAAEALSGAARKLTAVVAAELDKIQRTADLQSPKKQQQAPHQAPQQASQPQQPAP